MFLLRSAFWLVVAFLVMKPNTDIGAAASALSNTAIAAGQQLISEQVRATDCANLQCQGGKAVLSAILSSSPSGASTMQDSNAKAPVPRPRPHWMG